MSDGDKKLKPLKHTHIFDENDMAVRIDALTHQDKVNHKFYIKGHCEETGKIEKERVILNIGVQKRNYFSRYPMTVDRDADGDEIKRVDSSIGHTESVIHSVAKQMLADGRITWINVPNNSLRTGELGSIAIKHSAFRFDNSSVEVKMVADEETQEFIRADAVLENTVTNDKMIVEIKVHHGVTDKKIETLKKLGIKAIEIDLSHLGKHDIDTADQIEDTIKRIFHGGMARIHWVYDPEREKLKEMLDGLAQISGGDLRNTNYKSGGEWYMYKSDVSLRIPKCQHLIGWDPATAVGRDKYVEEAQCNRCDRHLGVYHGDNGERLTLCNQSEYSTKEIIATLLRNILN